MKRKGRTFPYFDVDMNSITKTGKTMIIVDRNSIQTGVEQTDENGKIWMKRMFNPNEDEHIVKEITIPTASAAERKRLVQWMLDIDDPRYTIVYDHRRGTFHVEYVYNIWLEYLDSKYEEVEEEEVVEEEETEDQEDLTFDDEDLKDE